MQLVSVVLVLMRMGCLGQSFQLSGHVLQLVLMRMMHAGQSLQLALMRMRHLGHLLHLTLKRLRHLSQGLQL